MMGHDWQGSIAELIAPAGAEQLAWRYLIALDGTPSFTKQRQ